MNKQDPDWNDMKDGFRAVGDAVARAYREFTDALLKVNKSDYVLVNGEEPKMEKGEKVHKIEVYKGTDSQWRWHYKARNGKILADGGEGYVERTDCVAGALSVLGLTLPTKPLRPNAAGKYWRLEYLWQMPRGAAAAAAMVEYTANGAIKSAYWCWNSYVEDQITHLPFRIELVMVGK